MSSDSEDDCYGNIAQRLQSMKNKYSEDKIETTNLLIADLEAKPDNSWRKNVSLTEKDCDLSQSQNSETAEEYTLDAIIAKNSKTRVTRSKRVAVCDENILPVKNRRKRIRNSVTSQRAGEPCDADVSRTDTSVLDTSTNSNNNSVSETASTRGRGRGRGRGRQTTVSDPSTNTHNDSVSEEAASTQGRGRSGGRARQTTPRRGRVRQTTIPELTSASCSNTRGRRRGRGRRRYWDQQEYEPLEFDLMAAISASTAMANHGTVYSVGNCDEYPDESDDQPLFNNKPNNVVVVEENELDENEELSVKVYWQSSEHVKFNIRRFQKLTKIFDYFAERENVSKDKLFFTYNDKMLRSDDTPDSINYSIVKFIDGGVINQSVSGIVKNDEKKDGIKLKFQCQNVKKPFLTYIRPDDTMTVVMMKCAEHLDKPLDKLKFHFDGDLITAKHTARELEFEGGECIDVNIIS